MHASTLESSPIPVNDAAAWRMQGRRILLSAALPDTPTDGHAHVLASFVVTFVQAVVGLGATVVFGGHPSITPLVHRALQGHTTTPAVELHQGAFWRRHLCPEAEDRSVFANIHWHGDGETSERDLAALREAMIRPGLDGAVFVGGGRGIDDELERFCAACPDRKALILGLAGGAAVTLVGSACTSARRVDPAVAAELATTRDVDRATARIIAELLDETP